MFIDSEGPEWAFALIPDEVVERVLVIGGGIAGLQAALDVAEAGLEAVLVEREPSLGGRVAQMESMFPTLEHAVCALREKMVEVFQHPRIRAFTNSELESLSGFGGEFEATIRTKARKVSENCNGCGVCWRQCPVKATSEFDFGMGTRAAIYLPFAQAIPAIPTIDVRSCLHFSQGCDICQRACPVGAVDFEAQDEIVMEKVGAVIVATGLAPADVTGLAAAVVGTIEDVITSPQLERMLSGAGPTRGEVRRPSDGKRPRSVLFISCPGFGTESAGPAFCSRVCCTNIAKQSIVLGKLYGDLEVKVIYSNIQTIDRDGEALIQRAQREYGAEYELGQVRRIERMGNGLRVEGENSGGADFKVAADLVVLATGIDPSNGFADLADKVGVVVDEHGFLFRPGGRLQPFDTTVAGIFAAGAALGPFDISESLAQGAAAVAKAIWFINRMKGLSEHTLV